MSYRPQAFGLNLPTGAVNTKPSSPRTVVQAGNCPAAEASGRFAEPTSDSGSAPVWKRVVLPARQAYSHSASVGSSYFFPSFLLSQSQNATASFHETLTTGWSSACSQPTFFQLKRGA